MLSLGRYKGVHHNFLKVERVSERNVPRGTGFRRLGGDGSRTYGPVN